jgi:hypothetical protein
MKCRNNETSLILRGLSLNLAVAVTLLQKEMSSLRVTSFRKSPRLAAMDFRQVAGALVA